MLTKIMKLSHQVEFREITPMTIQMKVSFIYSDNDFVLVLKNTYKLDAENGHVSHTKLLLYMDKKHARE